MKTLIISLIILSGNLGVAFAEPSNIFSNISPITQTLHVDKQTMITADIANGQDILQPFAYLTQVKNDQQVVVSLSWLTGSLSPRQSFSPAQSWTPSEVGIYTIEVFVWESIENPEALSPPLSMTVVVVNETT